MAAGIGRRRLLAAATALAAAGWMKARAGETMATGLDTKALAAMDAKLAAHVGDEMPGLVTLVARGDDLHVTVAGALDFGGPPMRRDTIFRIASMTKPVAAAAAMVLVDDGVIALDEPVGRLLPELAAPRVLARLDGPIDETVPARAADPRRGPHDHAHGNRRDHGPGRLPDQRRHGGARHRRRAPAAAGRRTGRLHGGARRAAADAPARRVLALRHEHARARRADRARRRAAARGLHAGAAIRAARHGRDRLQRAAGQARPAGRVLVAQLRHRRLRALRRPRRRQPVRDAPGLRLGLRRAGVHRRRLPRLRADDAGRRRAPPAGASCPRRRSRR